MRRLCLSLPVLLIALLARAEVYKGVGPDGRPIYTDRPLPDAAPVELSGLTSAAPEPASADTTADDQPFLGAYDAFAIVAPKAGTTIRSADGRVAVSLLLDPPLQSGHRLRLEVDGVAASGDHHDRTQLALSGVTIGSHRLQAAVIDDAGSSVARTELVHFHLREPLPEGSMP